MHILLTRGGGGTKIDKTPLLEDMIVVKKILSCGPFTKCACVLQILLAGNHFEGGKCWTMKSLIPKVRLTSRIDCLTMDSIQQGIFFFFCQIIPTVLICFLLKVIANSRFAFGCANWRLLTHEVSLTHKYVSCFWWLANYFAYPYTFNARADWAKMVLRLPFNALYICIQCTSNSKKLLYCLTNGLAGGVGTYFLSLLREF